MTLSTKLSREKIEEAASFILDACTAGRLIERLPVVCTPSDVDDAYAIQTAILEQRNHDAGGWFVAASNPDMQRQLGLKEAYSARWGNGRFLGSGAVVSSVGSLPVALEAEITFRLGRDLLPREKEYGVAEVIRAVDAVFPSFEVVISCFSDWMEQQPLNLIAEGGVAQLLVLGAPVQDWRSLNLAETPVTVRINGAVAATGSGGNVMGDPINVLVWLANHSSRRGIGLRRGELCNTGMCAPVCFVKPGDQATTDFGALGTVDVAIGRGKHK